MPSGASRVYRADGTETTLDAAGVLDGEDVLPGFRCTLAALLGETLSGREAAS